MAIPAVIAGVLLIVIGIVGYTSQDPSGKVSPTALIPAAFGIAIGLCGVLAIWKENLRKHTMHAAAALSLIGMVCAPVPFYTRIAKGIEIDPKSPAIISSALTTLVCAVFLAMCIRSFAAVRRARQAAATQAGS
jgi:hypothetical protein